MQNEYEIKKEMCEIGKRVYNRGMVAANDGNFSVRISENEVLSISVLLWMEMAVGLKSVYNHV